MVYVLQSREDTDIQNLIQQPSYRITCCRIHPTNETNLGLCSNKGTFKLVNLITHEVFLYQLFLRVDKSIIYTGWSSFSFVGNNDIVFTHENSNKILYAVNMKNTNEFANNGQHVITCIHVHQGIISFCD